MSFGRRRDEPAMLLEAAVSAFRERDAAGRLRPAPAWADLTPDRRQRLFELQLEARHVERALADDGRTSTATAVLQRALRIPQLPPDSDE